MSDQFFKVRNVIILVLLVILASLVYWWLNLKQVAPDTKSDHVMKTALTVETTQVKTVKWPMRIDVNGGVFAWQEAIVSSEISGVPIRNIHVDIGDQVKKGQPLLTLANETILAQLQRQQAIVDRDKALLNEATANATRAKEIESSGALSKQKFDNYIIAEQTAKANLALSMAELKTQQIQMRQTTITAADDGVISARSANLGDVVAMGSELFRYMRQGRIEWRAELNTDQLQKIKTGQRVEVISNQADAPPIIGTVRLVSPMVNNQSRNALVYIDLPKGSAKPGMYLSGFIHVGEQAAQVLPQSTVVFRDGMAYVFEVLSPNQDGIAKVIQHKVVVGRAVDDRVEVLQGVNAQAQYILTGGAFLNDGDTVKVIVADKGAK